MINLWSVLGYIVILAFIVWISVMVYATYVWFVSRPSSKSLWPYVVGVAPDVVQGRFWDLKRARHYARIASLGQGVSINVYNSRGRQLYNGRRKQL